MKEKWQSIRGFFRKNSRKLIPLLLLAAILLPIVVDNSYVLGICTKILLYMLLASSVNVINGYSGQFAIGHAGFLCVGAYTAAILMARANVPFFLAMLGAGVMTALFGMLVSFPIGKLSGIYLCEARTKELFDEYGIEVDPKESVKNLSTAQMQMVEIARAISYGSRIVIMDEPTSALSDKEVKVLYKIIRKLTSNGVAVLFISHKLEEVFDLADRVTIFRDGHMVGQHVVKDITMDDLINGIAGRKVENLYPKEDIPKGEVLLDVKHLNKQGVFEDINFQVRAGEVLGFAGLVGAGRTEIMQGIYGIAPADSGEIYVEGKKVVNRSPREGLNHGIAMVTEDRLRQGVVKKMNVQLNMTLSYFYRICKAGIINTNRENEDTDKMIRELHVKTAGREMPIWSLSGGNQQKVMIGRALLTNPKVLIMDEPTRGVDVGAKSEIYDYCNMLAKEGMAIILISSDLPEVMGMSDRMVVVREGRIVAEHERDTVTAEQVMSEMFGLTTAQKPEV